MKETNFYKLCAAGNDFVLFPQEASTQLLAKIPSLCDRNFGIGADGIIFLYEKENAFYWDFFNNDASPAQYCGNAARAITAYACSQLNEKTFKWSDKKQTRFLGTKNHENSYAVTLDKKLIYKHEGQASAPEKLPSIIHKIAYFNAGVPHAVLHHSQKLISKERHEIKDLFLANDPAFLKKWNLTFLNSNNLEAVCIERGVETETLACGSAALSCYLSLQESQATQKAEATFQFPGGALKVYEKDDQLWLEGDAKIVFKGSIHVDIFKP